MSPNRKKVYSHMTCCYHGDIKFSLKLVCVVYDQVQLFRHMILILYADLESPSQSTEYTVCQQQELMNDGEKERWTSVPILCRITLQNVPYMDYKLLIRGTHKLLPQLTETPHAYSCFNLHSSGILSD